VVKFQIVDEGVHKSRGVRTFIESVNAVSSKLPREFSNLRSEKWVTENVEIP